MSSHFKAGISLARHAIKLLESLTEEEIVLLESGQATLELRVNPKSLKKESPADEEAQMAEVRSKLATLRNRDEGSRLLREALPTKTKLQRFVKTLDLGYHKDEPAERLIEKIVEATIGYKLRSRAVTGATDQLP